MLQKRMSTFMKTICFSIMIMQSSTTFLSDNKQEPLNRTTALLGAACWINWEKQDPLNKTATQDCQEQGLVPKFQHNPLATKMNSCRSAISMIKSPIPIIVVTGPDSSVRGKRRPTGN